MGKAKITITGTAERQPKINDDGTVDLIFKLPMALQVPKGLKPLGESYYLVHISSKSWKKVSAGIQDDSFYIIQGETKASKTKSGTPLIEVVCFDISIKDGMPEKKQDKIAAVNSDNISTIHDNVVPKENNVIDKKSDSINLAPSQRANGDNKAYIDTKKEHKRVKWYVPEEIIYIPAKDVSLSEISHLSADSLLFNGLLKAVSISGDIITPLVVRPLSNGKFALVMGIRQYTVAKMLNLEMVPVVIRDKGHDELINDLGIDTEPR